MAQEFEYDSERSNPYEEQRQEFERFKRNLKADDLVAMVTGWFIVSMVFSFIAFYSMFLLWFPPTGVHLIFALVIFLMVGLAGNTGIGYFFRAPPVYVASVVYWIACLIILGNNKMFPLFQADLFATLKPWASE